MAEDQKVSEITYRFGPMEIKDSEKRAKVREALAILWVAMDLDKRKSSKRVTRPNELTSDHLKEFHLRAHRSFGEQLLGEGYRTGALRGDSKSVIW